MSGMDSYIYVCDHCVYIRLEGCNTKIVETSRVQLLSLRGQLTLRPPKCVSDSFTMFHQPN